MAQESGSSAELLIKHELTQGVVETPAVGGGASTTLALAYDPATDTDIEVVDETGMVAGDILKIGGAQDEELMKIGSGYVSGTTIPIEQTTKLFVRHAIGDAVLEVDPTVGWRKLQNFVSFNPNAERPLVESEAIVSERMLSGFRAGNFEASSALTIEFGFEAMGIWLYYSMADDYGSIGTVFAGASTTSDANYAIGDIIISVTSEAGFAVGEFAQIGVGAGAEIIKIGAVSAGQLDLDLLEHPNGLRKAHISGVAVDEVVAPFTHTVKTGSKLPEGCTFLLRFTGTASSPIALVRGNKLNTASLTQNAPDVKANITTNWISKGSQLFTEDIFGAPDITYSHTPYAHYEAAISIDDTPLTTNLIQSLTLNKNNNVTGEFVIGSPFRGGITEGQGEVGGEFTYQYNDTTFSEKTLIGSESKFKIAYTSLLDANHSIEWDYQRVIFVGNALPAAESRDPVTDPKTFSGAKDTTSGTDVTITYVTNEPVLI